MGSKYIKLNDFRKNPKAYSVPQLKYLCSHQKLGKQFMRDMKDHLNWYVISAYQKLDEEFIEEMSDKIDWMTIWGYQHLSENFVRKHMDKINWREVCYNGQIYLSKKFVIEYIDKLDITNLIYGHAEVRTEELYRTFYQSNFFNSKTRQAMSANPPNNVSVDFIREFRDKISLDYKITKFNHSNEQFFREFKDKIGLIGWEHISFWKKHTWDFLMRFKERINWYGIQPCEESYLTKEQQKELEKYKIYLLNSHAVRSE